MHNFHFTATIDATTVRDTRVTHVIDVNSIDMPYADRETVKILKAAVRAGQATVITGNDGVVYTLVPAVYAY